MFKSVLYLHDDIISDDLNNSLTGTSLLGSPRIKHRLIVRTSQILPCKVQSVARRHRKRRAQENIMSHRTPECGHCTAFIKFTVHIVLKIRGTDQTYTSISGVATVQDGRQLSCLCDMANGEGFTAGQLYLRYRADYQKRRIMGTGVIAGRRVLTTAADELLEARMRSVDDNR